MLSGESTAIKKSHCSVVLFRSAPGFFSLPFFSSSPRKNTANSAHAYFYLNYICGFNSSYYHCERRRWGVLNPVTVQSPQGRDVGFFWGLYSGGVISEKVVFVDPPVLYLYCEPAFPLPTSISFQGNAACYRKVAPLVVCNTPVRPSPARPLCSRGAV